MSAGGRGRWVDGLVIDVSDLERGAAFWSGLLGLKVFNRREQYLYMTDLAPGLTLILQEVSDVKRQKNGIHPEVRATDPAATIEWVLSQGEAFWKNTRPTGTRWW